jgi:hypothetical protein
MKRSPCLLDQPFHIDLEATSSFAGWKPPTDKAELDCLRVLLAESMISRFLHHIK